MSCVGFDRKDDPELHDHYSKKLLIPGWAGEVNDAEARYIADQLTNDRKLRQAWGVRQFFGKRWKHISRDMAKRLCAAWARNAVFGTDRASIASGEKDERHDLGKSLENKQQLALPMG